MWPATVSVPAARLGRGKFKVVRFPCCTFNTTAYESFVGLDAFPIASTGTVYTREIRWPFGARKRCSPARKARTSAAVAFPLAETTSTSNPPRARRPRMESEAHAWGRAGNTISITVSYKIARSPTDYAPGLFASPERLLCSFHNVRR